MLDFFDLDNTSTVSGDRYVIAKGFLNVFVESQSQMFMSRHLFVTYPDYILTPRNWNEE